MSSSLNVVLTINIAGAPLPFAQPFTVPILETEQEAAVYQVTVPANDSGLVWDGAPLGTTADFIALVADRAARYQIDTNSGSTTLTAATAGIPTVLSGGQIDTGSGLEDIMQITATNVDTDNPMAVSVCIAQAAS